MISRLSCLSILSIASFFPLGSVRATWSIVAYDAQTEKFGVSAATCITDTSFYGRFFNETFVATPTMAIMAQAWYTNPAGLAEAQERFGSSSGGQDAESILNFLLSQVDEDVCFDPFSGDGNPEYPCDDASVGTEEFRTQDIRQYDIVTAAGSTVAYTGSELTNLYRLYEFTNTEETSQHGELESSAGSALYYSVQGNIVVPGTVEAVVNELTNQTSGEGCDFADTLQRAMEAVVSAQPDLGDARCQGVGKTALIGFLKIVDASNGEVLIDVQAISAEENEKDSVEIMRNLLDQFPRAECEAGEAGDFTEEDKDDGELINTSLDQTPAPTPASAAMLLSGDVLRYLYMAGGLMLLF